MGYEKLNRMAIALCVIALIVQIITYGIMEYRKPKLVMHDGNIYIQFYGLEHIKELLWQIEDSRRVKK